MQNKSNIKILDCTLRDGGYVNNWDFKKNNIKFIISQLTASKCEYIECGFLKNQIYDENKSLFPTFKNLEILLPQNNTTQYTLMINYGEIDISDIPNCDTKIGLRIAFKKEKRYEALKFCKLLKQKGYTIFINPMSTDTYTSSELLDMIYEVNNIKPLAFTIVDTTGMMTKKNILSLFYLIDNNLSEDIALGFHSHNNLQSSFSNAQILIEQNTKRTIIIDSTVFGMGRGAGNLCTELIYKYLNDNYQYKYEIVPIMKIIDEKINQIFLNSPWGYSIPYYLAAINHCHPNYARYLVEKQTIPVEIIDTLLRSIPENKKSSFDQNLIKQIYLDRFSKKIEDSQTLMYLKRISESKDILILGPGKSINTEQKIILDFIENKAPYIITLNFVPEKYKENLVFISNLKRFNQLINYSGDIMITSNIENISNKAKVLNYSSYLNNSKLYDNIALMLIELLIKIKVPQIYIAGLDGFSLVATDNYVNSDLVQHFQNTEIIELNNIMHKELTRLKKDIKINFLTNTLYFEKELEIQENIR